MVALSDIVTTVADQLSRNDLEAQIKRALDLSIRRYERELPYISEMRAGTITTSAGTIWYSTIDLSSAAARATYGGGDTAVDLKRLRRVRYAKVEGGAIDDKIDPLPFDVFQYWHESSVSGGEITHYTLYGGQMGFWPTPSDAQTITVDGWFAPTIPTADSDESVWFDEARELIEAATTARVARTYLHDYEKAQAYEAVEAVQAGVLRSDTARRIATGRIRPRW